MSLPPSSAPAANPPTSDGSANSYGDIFRSSALVGGSQGITLLIGMVQTKCVAYFLGPYGVGLNANYQSVLNLVSRFSGLGVAGSSIRSIAQGLQVDSPEDVSRSRLALQWISWLAGTVGSVVLLALAEPISKLTFGDASQTIPLMILAGVVLLRNLINVQSSLLQGHRRIDDLARFKVASALLTAIVGVGLYAWLGVDGIIPAIILRALLNWGLSWHYARRIPHQRSQATWSQLWSESRDLISIGMALMWAGVLAAGVAYLTRAMITRQFDLDAVGIFQSSFRLSGMFVGFVLFAMATDFYPRLSAVKDDHPTMNRLVNEQTEIGLLLSLPGLIATLTLAPWIIAIFYTPKFLPAVELLKWFILGCCCRVISWPMTYILLAKGLKKWMVVTDTLFHLTHLGLIYLGLRYFELLGTAIAFFVLYFVHVGAMLLVSRALTDFRFSAGVWRLLAVLAPMTVVGFLGSQWLEPIWMTGLGLGLSALATVFCLRQTTARVGRRHKLSRLLNKIPGGRF